MTAETASTDDVPDHNRTSAPAAPQRSGRGQVRVRRMAREDVDAVLALSSLAFPRLPPDRLWEPEELHAHIARFPQGQLVAELDGRILGSATGLLTDWETATEPHTWNEITGTGTLKTHDPMGDVYYGTEMMVHPDARGKGVGRKLMEARLALVRDSDLRAFVTGGRISGYREHADRLMPQGYVDAVVRGELRDPVLTPQLKWGLWPQGVLCGYMFDPPSLHHATLGVWVNPDYQNPP